MKNAVRVSEELQKLSHIAEDGLLAATKEIVSNLRDKQHEIQAEIQTHVQEIMDANHPGSSSSSASGSASTKNYGKKLKAKNRQIKNMQDGYVQIGNRLTAFYKEFDKQIRPLLAKQPAGIMLLSKIDRVLSASTGSSRLSRQSVAEICDEFVGDEYSESDEDAAPKVIHVDTGGIGLENVQLSINDISGNDDDEDELGEDNDDSGSGSGSDNESMPDTNSQKMDYYEAEQAELQAQAAEAKARAAKAKKALALKKKKRERQQPSSSSSSSGSARKKSRKSKSKSKSRRWILQ